MSEIVTPLTPDKNSDETAQAVSAFELTGPLILGMPEVTGEKEKEKPPLSTEAEKPPLSTEAEKPPVLNDLEKVKIPFQVDDAGVAFDPNEHKTDDSGKPIKNKNGRFYSRFIGRGGSKRKAESAAPAPSPEIKKDLFSGVPKFEGIDPEGGATAEPGKPQEGEKAPQVGQAEGLALLAVPTFDAILQGLFTPAIGANTEQLDRIKPFAANYFRKKDYKDIPEGWALALVIASVYGPNFAKPTVKERITLYVLKIKNFFGGSKK